MFTQALPVGEDGGLVLPVGEPVHITLRSPDVIHAFYVPKFLFKRDVVPGKENSFDFTVEEPGTYRGQCAELCGTYHGSMLFEVHALPKADYDAWLAARSRRPKRHARPRAVRRGRRPGRRGRRQGRRLHHAGPQRRRRTPPFTIHFKNEDAPGVPHNIEIKDASGAEVFKGDIIDGARTSTTPSPALAAGTYPFVCTVHPNMTGTLTVQ